jgi:hypothetical protein
VKKSLPILIIGLLLAVVSFCGFYYAGTASQREMLRESKPELAWLKKEFHVGDEEFARISKLHEAYLPQCAARCRIIAAQNEKLQQLLAESATVTPEIQKLLTERAQTRAECEAAMLKHFYEVSRTMPPEEGRRYLAWVQAQTCLSRQGMENSHGMAEEQN